jgi:hypothetical protein
VQGDDERGNERVGDAPGNFVVELGSCESKHCYELSFTVLCTGLLMVVLLLLFSPPKSVFYTVMMIVGYWYGMSTRQLPTRFAFRSWCPDNGAQAHPFVFFFRFLL